MTDDRAKTPRTLLVADHLWDALADMAAEMGSDRDALVNQALYTFARLNGFLVPADLERLSSAPVGRRAPEPHPPADGARGQAGEDRADERPPAHDAEPALDLEEDEPQRTVSEAPGPQAIAGQVTGRTLILTADGRELDVVKERFLIGRGKHCDLIINSGKVSREHAAITREGADYHIEDLGSSNGTWHDKRRISRRQIQEGDEYFICAEKLGCSFR